MTIIDITILFVVISTVFFFHRFSRSIQYNRPFRRGSTLIIVGLGFVGLFYLSDLLIMHVLPLITDRKSAMQLMVDLHLNYRWPVSLISLSVISLGLIGVIRGAAEDRQALEAEISMRGQAEKGLGISEDRFERAIAGTNDGLGDWNIVTGDDYFTPRWAEILGYGVDELAPTVETFNALVHPDDAERIRQLVQLHLDHKNPYDTELRMRKKDGNYLWVQTRGKAVWNADGKPIYMAGSLTDISKRKLIEVAIQESEARFRTVFETVETGTIVINTDGIIHMFNPAAETIFGHQAHEVEGRNLSMLMPEPDHSQHDGYLKNYMLTGVGKIICVGRQVVGLRKNGEKFPMQLEVGEMHLNGGTCFVGSVADLTEIQSLESKLQQSQKLEAVGQLTGGVAHDFNNLLAIIQGNLSLLADDIANDVNDDPMELLQPALEASERGASLTQRLLAFSRKQALQPTTLKISKLVTGMEDLLRRTLGETIDLRVTLQQGDWNAVVDPSQLESALLNLVLNARDAMPDGGRLSIETRQVALDRAYVAAHSGVQAGDYLVLSVSDNGTGIAVGIIDNVFDPFFTTKGVGKGSGLGLSMVHGFVKQSGGHVEIYSESDQGTTVKLYLPRSMEQPVVAEVVASPVLEGDGVILVVEDDAAVRRMVVRMINRLGYETIDVEDGKSALQIIESNRHIDLLLSDVVLPGGLSGPAIARAFHQGRPDLKVLFMSGYTETAIVHHGDINEGGQLISKPFSAKELGAKIQELLLPVNPV